MYILMLFFLSVLDFILETFQDERDTIWTDYIELMPTQINGNIIHDLY